MQKKNHFFSEVRRIPFRRIRLSCSVMKLCAGFLVVLSALAAAAAENLRLWQDFPARKWQSEYFPIGNGALGAMLDGGIKLDILQLNLDSLWTGDSNLSGNYVLMGSYQSLGELRISYDSVSPSTPYRRELDIARAVHTVSVGGQTRTAYVSAPDQVLVYAVRSGQPLSGRIVLRDSREGMAYRENGKEKKTYHNLLLQAPSTAGAEARLHRHMEGSLTDYRVLKVEETAILDVLLYTDPATDEQAR